MTDATLAEIEARLAKATPGPWRAGARGPTSKDDLIAYLINCVECSPLDTLHLVWIPEAEADVCQTGNGLGSEANADFIAHAPEDIATLLALVRQMAGALDDLVARAARFGSMMRSGETFCFDNDFDQREGRATLDEVKRVRALLVSLTTRGADATGDGT